MQSTQVIFLHKAMLFRLGEAALLPNQEKQTREVKQNETEEYAGNKRIRQTSEDKLNETQ